MAVVPAPPRAAPAAPVWLVVAAFAAVYLIWGSTYLAIRVAVASLPPLLMAGTRFLAAGGLLYAVTRIRSRGPAPRPEHWRSAALLGGLLLVGGNGGVSWAEQRVPSALTALVVASVPLLMILVDWLRPGGTRPGWAVRGGLLSGFVGVLLIVNVSDRAGHALVDPAGAGVLLLASASWAVGSVWARYLPQAQPVLLSVALQMIVGGAGMLALGLAGGEAGRFAWARVRPESWWALLYLIVCGAFVGFTAYAWLLTVCSPARVSTYAYVNPLIAVLLGGWLGREPLPPGALGAAVLIVGAVVLITRAKARPGPAPAAAAAPLAPPADGNP